MPEKFNALRNKLYIPYNAPRAKAMETLRATYIHERGGKLQEDEQDERVWLAGVLAMSLGLMHALEQEVQRFKDHVAVMARVINPHRHKK